jgi:putative effector of murein hydrolase LrgA (UPF0299 family)
MMSELRARRVAGRWLIGAFALLFLAAVVAVLATDGLAEDWWLIAFAGGVLVGIIVFVKWFITREERRIE